MSNPDHSTAVLVLANPAAFVTAPVVSDADGHPEGGGPPTSMVAPTIVLPEGSEVQPAQSGPVVTSSCLYFLVSAATEGPLAGLYKLGIADCLAARHQQHQKVWGDFDLTRSALLRVGSRAEARRLELSLRDALSGPLTESRAETGHKLWTTADFIACKSWRRYPGRRDEGYTEFYAVESLDQAMVFVEGWLKLCGERLQGARLQRGIDPTECTLGLGAEGSIAPGEKDRGPGLQARHRLRREREYAECEEQVVERMGQALALAQEYEERLLWVDMRGWQRRLKEPLHFIVDESLVDLYFHRFAPAVTGAQEEPPPPSAAEVRFEELLAPVLAKAACPRPGGWRSAGARKVCAFQDLAYFCQAPAVPHPVCAGTLRLRIDHALGDLEHSLLARYEALARQVQDRHPRQQAELRLDGNKGKSAAL